MSRPFCLVAAVSVRLPGGRQVVHCMGRVGAGRCQWEIDGVRPDGCRADGEPPAGQLSMEAS